VYQSWDLSFGGGSSGASWVVGQTWGLYGGHKYLLDMTRKQIGFSDTIAHFLKNLNKFVTHRVAVSLNLLPLLSQRCIFALRIGAYPDMAYQFHR
jgi:phage terminase large subunit-like protein